MFPAIVWAVALPGWYLVFFGPYAGDGDRIGVLVVLSTVATLLAAGFSAWLMRHEAVADREVLRWRVMFRWRTAHWSDMDSLVLQFGRNGNLILLWTEERAGDRFAILPTAARRDLSVFLVAVEAAREQPIGGVTPALRRMMNKAAT
jgi:hypothetical protein